MDGSVPARQLVHGGHAASIVHLLTAEVGQPSAASRAFRVPCAEWNRSTQSHRLSWGRGCLPAQRHGACASDPELILQREGRLRSSGRGFMCHSWDVTNTSRKTPSCLVPRLPRGFPNLGRITIESSTVNVVVTHSKVIGDSCSYLARFTLPGTQTNRGIFCPVCRRAKEATITPSARELRTKTTGKPKKCAAPLGIISFKYQILNSQLNL